MGESTHRTVVPMGSRPVRRPPERRYRPRRALFRRFPGSVIATHVTLPLTSVPVVTPPPVRADDPGWNAREGSIPRTRSAARAVPRPVGRRPPRLHRRGCGSVLRFLLLRVLTTIPVLVLVTFAVF